MSKRAIIKLTIRVLDFFALNGLIHLFKDNWKEVKECFERHSRAENFFVGIGIVIVLGVACLLYIEAQNKAKQEQRLLFEKQAAYQDAIGSDSTREKRCLFFKIYPAQESYEYKTIKSLAQSKGDFPCEFSKRK